MCHLYMIIVLLGIGAVGGFTTAVLLCFRGCEDTDIKLIELRMRLESAAAHGSHTALNDAVEDAIRMLQDITRR